MSRLSLVSRMARTVQSGFAKNTLWICLGQICWQCLRAVYFLIIARSLGAEQYGVFVGIVALVAIFSPFSSAGSGSLLIKNVSRDRTVFRVYWGNALLTHVVSGSLLALVIMTLSRFVMPAGTPTLLVVCVLIADLIFSRLLDVSAAAFQAFEMLGVTAQIYTFGGLARLLGAIALVLVVRRPTASSWAVLYLIAGALSALIAMLLVNRRLGMPKLATHLIRPEAREGLYFSCGQATENIYNDIDKTMLTALSALEGAGIYAAAYRIIDAAFVPINSVLWASYSHFFVKGSAGIDSSSRYAKGLLSRAGLYSICAGMGLFVFAPLVPHLLGRQYLQTAEALRWLSPILLIRTAHRFLSNSLTGAGFQGLRTAAQGGVAFFNVLLNLWLIPDYSWRGAAWSSLASDALLLVSLALLTLWLRRQETRTMRAQEIASAAP